MQDESAKKAPQIRATMPSSPQASIAPIRGSFAPKYPWSTIKVGESFGVSYTEMKLTSLRPFVHRMGKKHGKKFRVIDHGPDIGYEVACLPMDDVQAAATSSGIVEALSKTDFGFDKKEE